MFRGICVLNLSGLCLDADSISAGGKKIMKQINGHSREHQRYGFVGQFNKHFFRQGRQTLSCPSLSKKIGTPAKFPDKEEDLIKKE